MAGRERFSIVWKHADDELAQRFYVPGYVGMVPFFISGQDLERLENRESLELNERHLLEGVLYGLYELDNDPKPWHTKEDRHTLTYLLDVLGNGFGFESPEALLLESATDIRERNGSRASRIVLMNGLELVPFSSKIRSDLICDTWTVASENNDLEMIKTIPSWVMETTLSQLIPSAAQCICYYGLCSMVMTKVDGDDLTAYLTEFVYPNVEMRALKNKIKALLEKPTAYTLKDLELEIG